jgi:hypothetical protein
MKMAVVGWYENGCYGCHPFCRKMAVVGWCEAVVGWYEDGHYVMGVLTLVRKWL